MYSYNLEETLPKLKKYKNLLIQLPEGLRLHALKILDFYQSKGFNISYYLEPSYGACDLVDYKVKNLKIDCILHFGHTQMTKHSLPTIYIPVIINSNPEKLALVLNSFLAQKKPKTISLAASAQYLHLIEKIKPFLKTKILNNKPKVTQLNQILGCDFTVLSQKADLNIILSDSLFHAQGALVYSKKPTYLLDIVEEKIIDIEKEKDKFLRKRISAISKAQTAKTFGIILTTKPGQSHPEQAKKAQAFLKKRGKKSYLFITDKLNPNDLLALKIDCLINTACPRIAIDDSALYSIPLINYSELKYIDNLEDYL